MTLHNEVYIIFAATNGYLDDLPVELAHRFQKELYVFMEDKYPDIGHTIEKTGAIDDQLMETIKKALTEFKGQFKR